MKTFSELCNESFGFNVENDIEHFTYEQVHNDITRELISNNEDLKRCYKELLDDYMKIVYTYNMAHCRKVWEDKIKFY